MSTITKKLLSIAVALFFVSLFTYYIEHRRGYDLVAGAEFISGLDISKIERIVIKSKAGQGELDFVKEGPTFVLAGHNSFPADTGKINEFLYKVASIQIAEKVSSSDKSYNAYGVAEGIADATVALYGKENSKLVEFYLGSRNNNGGSHIRNVTSSDTYLTMEGLSIETEKDFFIDKTILNLKTEDIVTISAAGEFGSFVVKKDLAPASDGSASTSVSKFVLATAPAEKVDQSKIDEFVRAFNNISFTEFIAADDAKLKSVKFESRYEVKMADAMAYLVEIGVGGSTDKDKKYYCRISSNINELPAQVQLNKDADKAELEKVNQMLLARDKANIFNNRNGRWVYEIVEYKFKSLNKGRDSFK
ncbi:MAG: hypothetical protein A2504_02660 [Bdellovibrionales bacterium RIFOXYD12_FULL_39_22]|nr:MAG: hypothetical protein A2385_12690 [Bdellovibrionales bacterium RIFOXYB1_FULL_39_21]OFZ41206.1 MAG: hypothetical protein A2485_01100 [Bdellovibrionales bacterium RIFOXYC12_FULL_39_17]OFZ44960.1 MAG: hypothetical protein A2404_11845 [Bdellovibrionales bacterium RIFOXYC1_FULL_39_130]OFZ74407.1 MAG: hypothetical protein A2560_12215 [Bdellovibrionales bacterium RIFOXYD1_FULL_39_84]OFZ74728.1 MAG: hypothetical protein A2451_09980 [Bdellovibrionales bacterium RIFOXYC2_FULL_39_8]OFZ92409.1 MAG: